MAGVTNGDSDVLDVEIKSDDASAKISSMKKKLTDLEESNAKFVNANDDYEHKVGELKAVVDQLSDKNKVLENELEKAAADYKKVDARAAELEADVSSLNHNLADQEVVIAEVSGLKRDLEEAREREQKKGVLLTAIEKERELLRDNIARLEGVEASLKAELQDKEKEINRLSTLVKNVDNLESELASSKKLTSELENAAEKMKSEIIVLKTSLEEKEKMISGLAKERELADFVKDDVNVEIVGEGQKKGLIGGWKQKNYLLVCGSTVAAFAVMGAACFVHGKKH